MGDKIEIIDNKYYNITNKNWFDEFKKLSEKQQEEFIIKLLLGDYYIFRKYGISIVDINELEDKDKFNDHVLDIIAQTLGLESVRIVNNIIQYK